MELKIDLSDLYKEYNALCKSMYEFKKLTVPVRMLYVKNSVLVQGEFTLPDIDFFSVKAAEYENALSSIEFRIVPGIQKIIRQTESDNKLYSLYQASREFFDSCQISAEKIKQNLSDSTCYQLEQQLYEVS